MGSRPAHFSCFREQLIVPPSHPPSRLPPSLDMPVTTRRARRLMRPTLPTEVIGQILKDSQLSKMDLVQCCLANHWFLAMTRPIIYREVTLVLLTGDIEDGSNWSFNESSARFFEVIEENPTLAGYVRSVAMTGEHSYTLCAEERIPGYWRCGEGSFGVQKLSEIWSNDGKCRMK